jgi:predicted transcriptional regulator
MNKETWDGVDRRREADELRGLTAEIVAALVSNNTVAISDLPQLISSVFTTLAGLSPSNPVEAKPVPKVSVRASVKPDAITCLEDGKPFKVLKHHLKAEHGMTPAEYRERWNLSPDYPMTAPNYSAQRRGLAKTIGLGRRAKAKA